MSNRFLEEDLNVISERRAEVCERLKELTGEIHEASDSLDRAELMNEQKILSLELNQLDEVIRHAKLIKIDDPMRDRVSVGSTVKFINEKTKEVFELSIGTSQAYHGNPHEVSYASPIAALLVGAKIGDVKTRSRGVETEKFKVLSIK